MTLYTLCTCCSFSLEAQPHSYPPQLKSPQQKFSHPRLTRADPFSRLLNHLSTKVPPACTRESADLVLTHSIPEDL